MSATSTVSADSADSAARPRIVIAGAGPAAQALVRQLTRTPFAGGITVLSNRDDAPEELLELAALPQVSVRFGQPASYIDPDSRYVTTADGMEFSYDQLVIATGSSPAGAPLAGEGRCLSYSTIDDAARLGEAVKDVTRVLGRRPLGILVGTGTAAGQAEAVLRARGVRPIRTTQRPAAVVPTLAGSALAAAGVVFEDGSSMTGDLVVLAEEPIARDALAASAGLKTAAPGRDRHRPGLPHVRPGHLGHRGCRRVRRRPAGAAGGRRLPPRPSAPPSCSRPAWPEPLADAA